LEEQFPLLTGHSEYDIWKIIFDDDILRLIQEETQRYARREKGLVQFQLSCEEVKNFLGILLVSGYHSLPSERDYWSKQPDLHLPLIADTMSLNRYKQIKSCIHLADNNHLQHGNKVAKVTPLYDLLNRNLQQWASSTKSEHR
jgi:hypothetical protein